jgi:organic radical activating enzyme
MSKIKVAELFYTLQGEGQYLGTPSVFLRVFGCNFQCEGFSMPRGELSTERLEIDPKDYKNYNDLPLVHTGCDSYASWDVRFKHLSPMMSITSIVDKMVEMLPNGVFGNDCHLILTGGEPLLGWQRTYIDLLEEINDRGMDLNFLTFETNGTQKLTDELLNYLDIRGRNCTLETTFSISSKLPSSGESWSDAIKPEIVKDYTKIKNHRSYFKWVVSNEDDYQDVVNAIAAYRDGNVTLPVYLMPSGGTTKVYDTNEKWVADLAMKNGWRYTPRLQVQLWKNAWGT